MKLHHVGMVVPDIARSGQRCATALGVEPSGPVFLDPIQQVYVQFWSLPGSDSNIEFIQPASESSPSAQLLKRGGGLTHLCFEVQDLERAVEDACSRGALVVQHPLPAEAFGGRRIAFVIYQDLGVLEFVESEDR